MTYTETIDYLYSKLPVFHRTGPAALKPSLDNILKLCEILGNPHKKLRCIHVGGTNGKGSVSSMLSAILQSAGFEKVGLFTSPHLIFFTERIRINEKPISEEWIVQFVENHKDMIEDMSPSFFEITTAMTFLYFAEQQVDWAIIEVGLGGRLDSTNIITPELSVITNISYDHTDLLGNTLEMIASEKAGIIKPNVPVVIGQSHSETEAVFIKKASEMNAEITFAEKEWKAKIIEKSLTFQQLELVRPGLKNRRSRKKSVICSLIGDYQIDNIITCMECVVILRKIGVTILDKARYQALANIQKLTGLRGRMEILNTNPTIIADVAHNAAGIQQLLSYITNFQYDTLRIVFGMVKDKDIEGVLQLLPTTATYYFVNPNLLRALPASELHQKAQAFNLQGNYYKTVANGFQTAINEANTNDLMLITGSFFVVGEVLSIDNKASTL